MNTDKTGCRSSWFALVVAAAVVLVVGSTPAWAEVFYADSTLKADITDGTYSIRNRAPGGTDGNAYATINAGVKAMKPGDTLLLRGGTFRECRIDLRGKTGTADAWFTMRSYPGEWAVVDAEHRGIEGKRVNVFGGHVSTDVRTPEDAPAYWRFQWFEVTGGGAARVGPDGKRLIFKEVKPRPKLGAGFLLWGAHHMVFDHLYIHGNYGGIRLRNTAARGADAHAPHEVVITHCYLTDNSFPGMDYTGNGTHVRLYGDHSYFKKPVDIHTANTGNEVRYNLMEGGTIGYADKYMQFICMDHVGTDIRGQARGNRIHHNIVRNTSRMGIFVCQDFAQVYNNIVDTDSHAIVIGKTATSNCREPFYVAAYNNLVITSRLGIYLNHGCATFAQWPRRINYHYGLGTPFCHFWNNIVQYRGEGEPKAGIVVRFAGKDAEGPSKVDMRTVHIGNNYFPDRSNDTLAVQVGGRQDGYSADAYVAKGWAKAMYAGKPKADDPLYKPGSKYKTRGEHKLNGKTIATGGRGGDHPYLDGVKIPGYVGPTDRKDDAWVDEVLNLKNLGKMQKAPAR